MLRCLPLCLLVMLSCSGCIFLPEFSERPIVRNPFPQLSRVAVAPFFNLSAEPGVDGRQFALAYFDELQSVPGFEVVPVGVVENAMEIHGITLASAAEVRRLAQILGVDAVAIGAVTDYSPYYPPRCGLRVEWYAANACFNPIPAGYGLPWGTPMEEEIPEPLIFEAAMAKATAEYKALTPTPPTEIDAGQRSQQPSNPEEFPAPEGKVVGFEQQIGPNLEAVGSAPGDQIPGAECAGGCLDGSGAELGAGGMAGAAGMVGAAGVIGAGGCVPSNEPVLRHTRIYNGSDGQFTKALETYYYFRDDARFGGWQAYLQRSDDFIRFCCHMHISEMLSARGGAGESPLVVRWPDIR